MYIIILIYLILFFIISWRKLDWSIFVILATLPSYQIRFQVLGIPFTILEAMILIAFFVWFIRDTCFLDFLKNKYKLKDYIENTKKRGRYPFGMEMILLLIISFISVGVAGFSNEAFGIWKAYFFEPVLFFLLLINVFGKKIVTEKQGLIKAIEPLIFALGFSAFYISIFAIYQKITGQFIFNELWAAEETRRVVSVFPYPNAVGLYLGPLVLLFVGYLIQIPRKTYFKLFFISVTIVLSLISIYFAKSEGALIGVVAGLVVFGFLSGGKIRWATYLIIVLGLLGILSQPVLLEKISQKVLLKDVSGEIRKQQWRETWEMLNDGRIIQGSGLANYQNAISPYHQEGIFYNFDNDPDFRRKIVIFDEKYKAQYWQPVEIYMYPHNIILNFWTELGLAGMILFVWMFIKLIIISLSHLKIKDIKYLNLGILCSFVVLIIHGLVDVPYFKNDLSLMFWFFVFIVSLARLNDLHKEK